jgi:serine phosphatase RsbU (regulator of sigma subunit)
MLLAEVCSCGSVFAELAAELRDLMMRNINTVRQARFVRDLNERLRTYSERGGYASVILGTYFAPTRSLALCNAGHPLPLIYRAADGHWSAVRGEPISLSSQSNGDPGVLDECEYQHVTTQLAHGDMVFCYSSALTECRDAAGHFLGVAGVLDRLSHVDAQEPGTIITSLLAELREEHDENLAVEDATLLLYRATSTPVRWRDNLLAPWRLLGTATNNTHVS